MKLLTRIKVWLWWRDYQKAAAMIKVPPIPSPEPTPTKLAPHLGMSVVYGCGCEFLPEVTEPGAPDYCPRHPHRARLR